MKQAMEEGFSVFVVSHPCQNFESSCHSLIFEMLLLGLAPDQVVLFYQDCLDLAVDF